MDKKTVILFFVTVVLFLPQTVFGATLSVSPASGTFEVGDRVTVRILVSSDMPINAVSGTVSFPPVFLVESVSKTSSILNFWVTEPNFSQSLGKLTFEGVALGGFPSGTGNVVTLVLRAQKEGSGTLAITTGQILANDGQGTDLTGSFSSATYIVKARTVIPREVPIQESSSTENEEVEKELPQNPPSLTSPEIVLKKRFGENVVEGASVYSRAQVLLTLRAETGEKVFVLGQTNDGGAFTISIPQTLRRGTYMLSAVIINSDLSHSTPSNEVTFVTGTLFSDISIWVWVVLAIVAVIMVFVSIRALSFIVKNKKIRRRLKKETAEAERVVRTSFRILEEEVEGGESLKQIKRDLHDAEKVIMKEVKDIDRL